MSETLNTQESLDSLNAHEEFNPETQIGTFYQQGGEFTILKTTRTLDTSLNINQTHDIAFEGENEEDLENWLHDQLMSPLK